VMGGEFEHLGPYVRTALQGFAQQFERTVRLAARDRVLMHFRLAPDLDEASEVRGVFLQMTPAAGR